MEANERDEQIALEYLRGDPASTIHRRHGLSISHVRKILRKQKAVRGDVITQSETEKVVDPAHQKLGLILYHYRFKKGLDCGLAADLMGWTSKKLRNVENGHSVLTLFDLTDMANYLEVSLGDLIKRIEE